MKFPNIANLLKTATTNVNIANASAPTTGQVLTATSSTTAIWQNPTWGTMSNGTPITATQWQTVCTAPTYVIWNNKLEVYLNWILQEITQDYTETSTTSITFVTWLLDWDRVTYKLLS